MRGTMVFCGLGIWLVTAASAVAQEWLRDKLRAQLPLLGHRNWVVVADSAYPLQTAPGIETVYVDADQVEVLQLVLAELGRVKHVKPLVLKDAELAHVPEKSAPGIDGYRAALTKALGSRVVHSLPHEQIIARLDEAGKTFKVLLIKTRLTLPYTSVFLQLDCGYWDGEAEKALREAMKR